MSFFETDMRVGTILAVEIFPEARKPAYKVTVDFGPEIGIRRSSAQITEHYTPEWLIGERVIGVVNLPPRQIGPFISEVLLIGAYDTASKVKLLEIHGDIPNGAKIC